MFLSQTFFFLYIFHINLSFSEKLKKSIFYRPKMDFFNFWRLLDRWRTFFGLDVLFRVLWGQFFCGFFFCFWWFCFVSLFFFVFVVFLFFFSFFFLFYFGFFFWLCPLFLFLIGLWWKTPLAQNGFQSFLSSTLPPFPSPPSPKPPQ